ncbi:MAG: AzlC family ABC transporter permease [Caldilineaceae bacterium]
MNNVPIAPSEVPSAHMASQEFWAGVKGIAPILLGVFPFGLIYGILAVSAGLPTILAQAMSLIVFAGSAQFVIAQLAAINTPLIVITITAAVVNIRHMLYSASVAPHLSALSTPWKMVLAYLLTDEAYAVAITRYAHPADAQSNGRSLHNAHWFFLGAGLGLWITWQLTTAIGIFVGTQIPASWELDFSLPLTFIALVAPMIKDRAAAVTVVTAGVAALLVFHMPLKLGLVTAILSGIVAGLLFERD